MGCMSCGCTGGSPCTTVSMVSEGAFSSPSSSLDVSVTTQHSRVTSVKEGGRGQWVTKAQCIIVYNTPFGQISFYILSTADIWMICRTSYLGISYLIPVQIDTF